MKRKVIILITIFSVLGVILYFILGRDNNEIVNNSNFKSELGEKFTLIEELNSKYILDYKLQDIDNDNEKEEIILIGDKENQSDVFSKNMYLIVRSKKNEKVIKYEIKGLEGYENHIVIENITDTNVSSIVISANKSGDKNIKQYIILEYKNGKLKEIFDIDNNKGLKVSGKYLDQFKAEINIQDLNKTIQVEIQDKKEYYLKKKQYDDKEICLNKTKEIKISEISLLEVVQLEDNTKGLRTKQMLFGIDNTDILDIIEVTWKFNKNKLEINNIQSQRIGQIK